LTEITKLPVQDNIFGAEGLESASSDGICDYIVSIYGGESGITAICGAATAMTQLKELPSKAEPDRAQDLMKSFQCPNPFSPDYPSGDSYDLVVAPISSLYLFGGKQSRSNANAYSQVFIGRIAAAAAVVAAGICDNTLLEIISLGGCTAAKVAVDAAFVAVDKTIESIDVQDGLIDGAEIQAAFENTKTIITQNCGIEESIGGVGDAVVRVENAVAIVNYGVKAVDFEVKYFRIEANGRFDTIDSAIEVVRSEAAGRFDNVDVSILGLQKDVDMDSLKLSIESTEVQDPDTETAFLVLSAERGVEKAIDLVIDCFDEDDLAYRTQPFTRTEISEGTTLVKFPKSKSSNKGRLKLGNENEKGKGGCTKIRRFKGTAKEESRSGVRSVRTVIRGTK
jgi:hypothetical protein